MNSIDGLFHTWKDALGVWALFVATGGVFVAARKAWRATLGSARFHTARYRRLAPAVRHEYVKGLFGEPAWEHRWTVEHAQQSEPEPPRRSWMRRARRPEQQIEDPVELTVRVWPLGKIAYLTTWCTSTGEVAAYGLTTRSRWLRPRINIGPDHRIKLGKSRLAELPADGSTWNYQARIGARRYAYAEEHYFGNPGHYRHWFVGVCDAGSPGHPPIGARDTGKVDEQQLQQYRAGAVINSVLICRMVCAVSAAEANPYSIGPDLDTVRLMDTNTSRWQRWRQHRHRRKLTRTLQRSIEPGQPPAIESGSE